jgi:hypothetical protein
MIILTHTHSDNKDIWLPHFDLLQQLFKKIKIHVLTDNKDLFLKTISNIPVDNIHEYFEKDTYPSRILSYISKIDYKYILLLRDTDWILKCNEDKIISLIPTMQENDIDRLSLYHDNTDDANNINNIVNINDTDYILKSYTNYYILSLMPSLWKTSSLCMFYEQFSHFHYSELESEICQTFVRTTMNVYYLHSKLSIHESWSTKLVPYFEFIHLAYHAPKDTLKSIYGSFLDDVFELHKKYNINYEEQYHNKIKFRKTYK